ncbi:MAG: hypothetical protein L0154_15495 [Chloroflexi bacterium]|nr:hypothetical protein [Chloroflexota bacterium]
MKLIRLLFIIVLLLMPLTTFAQDETDLSEAEIALLDRMLAGFEYRDSVSSYAFNEMNEVTLNLELSRDGDSGGFSQEYLLEREGYLLRDPLDNIKEFFTLDLSGEDDERGEYELTADATFVGDILYLETPDEFYTIESRDDIPEDFSNASLGGLFDDEPSFIQNRELLLSVLESVTEEDDEVDDEMLTLLTLTVAEDRVADFIWELFNTDRNAGNPTILALRDFGEGSVVIEAWLDEEDHLRRIEFNWDIEAVEVDLGQIDEQYAGNRLDIISVTQSATVELGEYEAEFDPIEVPAEPF